jgi:putative transposase
MPEKLSTFVACGAKTIYRSPAPETWHPEIKTRYGEVESKLRFPLPHTLDGDEISTKLAALH